MPDSNIQQKAVFPPQQTCTLPCPNIYLRVALCALPLQYYLTCCSTLCLVIRCTLQRPAVTSRQHCWDIRITASACSLASTVTRVILSPRRRQDASERKVTLALVRSVLQAGLLRLFGAIGGAIPFEVLGTLPAAGTAVIKADRRWVCDSQRHLQVDLVLLSLIQRVVGRCFCRHSACQRAQLTAALLQ